MTIREQLKQIEENWLPEGGTWEGSSEYVLPCKCGRMKFSWNVNKKVGNCFRCGFKLIGVRALRSHFGTTGGTETAPSQSWSPGRSQSCHPGSSNFIPASISPAAVEYLSGRGVSKELAEEIGILYKDERVWFPLTSPFGLIPFLLGRSINPDSTMRWTSFPGEKGQYVFGGSEKNGPVVLVEGVFGVLSSGLYGKAVALLGSKPSLELLAALVNRYSEVFVWFDPDEAGRNGSKYIKEVLHNWFPLCKVKEIIYNKEPDDCSVEESKEVLKEQGYH